MTHLKEEELIAQLYGEGDRMTRKRHLEQCAECSKAYSALRSDLSELEFAEPPERGVSYGERVWASFSPSLPVYEGRRRAWLARSLSYGASCVLLAACAFLGGRLWERKQTHGVAGIRASQNPQTGTPAPPREHVVVMVLSDHLDRSERLLVELKHVDADSAGLVFPLREEARSLLAENRIYLQNARQHDGPALAAALDRLNHLLEELADQPGGLNLATLTRVQNESNADGLLFEVRVLRSRLPEREVAASGHTKGGTI